MTVQNLIEFCQNVWAQLMAWLVLTNPTSSFWDKLEAIWDLL